MAWEKSSPVRRWKRAIHAFMVVIGCASCDLLETSPMGDPPPPPPDSGGAAGAAIDARADTSAPKDAAADALPDISIDAVEPADGSVADAVRDGASVDSARADVSTSDQLAPPDAPDADGKPRSPSCTVEQPCTGGDCIGQSCDQAWECFSHFAPHPCPSQTIPYCGCDGKTYFFPITCAEIPYEHAGACGDGVNCDPHDIRCNQPEPDCGPHKVASVVGTCYGPCVDITECRCVFAFECPKLDLYSCTPELHCGP